MARDVELAVKGFQVFLREVIDPAVFESLGGVECEAFQVRDPKGPLLTPAEVQDRPFAPVSVGWTWGPKWSTAWFRVKGRVPASAGSRPVKLRFSSGTEALVWQDDGTGFVPRQGLDVNRDAVDLGVRAGDPVSVLIEAACNHPFGVTGFEWDDVEVHRRWESPTPGRLERCELAVRREDVHALQLSFSFALGLLKDLPPESTRVRELMEALDQSRAAAVTGDWTRADAILRGTALSVRAPGSATTCHAVGHAHIDTAWLWPIRETRRKCLRTFSNVLRLMEQYPGFRFLCSQTQQYAWVEEASPRLFAQIAQRVAEGRWEPGGGMWVEPDVNVPSGESLVRQILHADRWWRRRFGERGRQRHLYLPDTFGFPACIPQIMALSGLDTFITNKMSWNQTNTFPHTTFTWRGIDGSEVLAHFTPGHDYNAVNTPRELRRGETNHRSKERRSPEGGARWLQPFGYGDGGGGPTERSIEGAMLARDCDGLPRVRLDSASSFCDHLHADARAWRAAGSPAPVWWGELYLELHRGTLTTQAWIKKENRRCEEGLILAEMISAVAGVDRREVLDAAWKRLMLNQFHDILPGTSIGWVYEDAREDLKAVRQAAVSVVESAAPGWIGRVSAPGASRPVVALNPSPWPQSGVVDVDGGQVFVPETPALGVRAFDAANSPAPAPVTVNGKVLENSLVRVELDDAGRVVSLRRTVPGGRDACRAGSPMNQLVMYEDRPHMWDAWDIDPSYERSAAPVVGPAESWRVVMSGPLRAVVEVSHRIGAASRITQRITLDAGSPRVDFRTRVDWHEDRRLLRALFPTDILATEATYDIQFGHVRRPTHRNTSWDSAKFEVCAHRWMDLAEPGHGLALLNDGKYGHSCHDGVMGLSLLRSPKLPDPQADMGDHEFCYSLLPHGGDWRVAGVEQQAAAINTPLLVRPATANRSGASAWSPIRVSSEGPGSAVVSAVKLAEDDDRLIVRLHESHGAQASVRLEWGLPVSRVETVDLLERPKSVPGFTNGPDATTMTLRPFQIVTLAATLAR